MNQGNQRTILYVGPLLFPEGNAAAARAIGIGCSLRDLDYAVGFCGYESHESVSEYWHDGRYEYRGFRFWPQDESGGKHESRRRQIGRLLFPGRNTLAWMCKPGSLANVSCIVILSSFNGLSVLRLARLCRGLAIPLVVDCTEWDRPGDKLNLTNLWKRLEIPFSMRYVHKRIGRLIVISRVLQDYYAARGCRVVRVPPTVDLHDPKWPCFQALRGKSLRLVYAGVPERKDLLDIVVRGLAEAMSLGIDVSIEIIGPSVDEIRGRLATDSALLSNLGSRIQISGRLPHKETLKHVAQADFSLLVRPDCRKTNACFPTKLVESLTCHVPVIANITTDLGEYLQDGREMLEVQAPDVPSFVAVIKRASELSVEERVLMKENARRTAERIFDYRCHTAALKNFLGRCGVEATEPGEGLGRLGCRSGELLAVDDQASYSVLQ